MEVPGEGLMCGTTMQLQESIPILADCFKFDTISDSQSCNEVRAVCLFPGESGIGVIFVSNGHEKKDPFAFNSREQLSIKTDAFLPRVP